MRNNPVEEMRLDQIIQKLQKSENKLKRERAAVMRAARQVIGAWEAGDLAAAVRGLAAVVSRLDGAA